MKPETLTELIISLAMVLVAVVSSIALKLDWVSHTTFFSVLTGSGALVGGFFALRHFLRSKPFFRDITFEDWKVISGVGKHRTEYTHREIAVVIPETTHKKGRYPRVEFFPET